MDERQCERQQRVDPGCARLGRSEGLGLGVAVNGNVVRGDGIDGAVGNALDDRFAVILRAKRR